MQPRMPRMRRRLIPEVGGGAGAGGPVPHEDANYSEWSGAFSALTHPVAQRQNAPRTTRRPEPGRRDLRSATPLFTPHRADHGSGSICRRSPRPSSSRGYATNSAFSRSTAPTSPRRTDLAHLNSSSPTTIMIR